MNLVKIRRNQVNIEKGKTSKLNIYGKIAMTRYWDLQA